MKVFRHDHIADHNKPIPLADFFQHLQKSVAARTAQPRLPAMTTARNEVQVSVAVVAMQAVGHWGTVLWKCGKGAWWHVEKLF